MSLFVATLSDTAASGSTKVGAVTLVSASPAPLSVLEVICPAPETSPARALPFTYW